jgi:thiamine kinase-like enzyme
MGNSDFFLEDLFSVAGPAFSKTSTKNMESIQIAVHEHYADVIGSDFEVEQCGGLEINSNNFKLETSRSKFLLKRLKIGNNNSDLLHKLKLNNWLHERGAKVPFGQMSDSKELIVESQSYIWCLFNFDEGHYFQGDSDTLIDLAKEAGRLHRMLKDAPAEFMPSTVISHYTSDEWDFIGKLCDGSLDYRDIISGEWAETYIEKIDIVLAKGRQLQENKNLLESMIKQPCHTDLHPHNVLVDKGRVNSFVDFESFNMMPAPIALGFAAYKLTRQSVAKAKKHDEASSLGERFVSALDIDESFSGSWNLLASAEVFRRVIIILRLNHIDKVSTWNHVLPIQVNGLLEIDQIFKK